MWQITYSNHRIITIEPKIDVLQEEFSRALIFGTNKDKKVKKKKNQKNKLLFQIGETVSS